MKPIQELKKALREELDDAVECAISAALDDSGYLQTCLNCKHFNEPKEHCTLAKPPARPPARTIAFGCQAFADASEAIADVVKSLPRELATQKKVGEVPNDPWRDGDWDDDIPF